MSDADWASDGIRNGWTMPSASWWKVLPGIRHCRALWHFTELERHDRFYRQLGMIPTGYDRWVLYGIWHGLEPQGSA